MKPLSVQGEDVDVPHPHSHQRRKLPTLSILDKEKDFILCCVL